MADTVFNIAKGRAGYYAQLLNANDALIAVPLETSGLESDAVLKDKDTLADVLSGTTNEQTTMGRKTLASVTSTVDDSGDKLVVDFADVTWTAASGNAVSKLVICYDSDTTGGTDANLIPLLLLDFVATPNGGDITYQVNAAGAYDAS